MPKKEQKKEFDVYVELYRELSAKKFNRKHRNAYLSCFLRVSTVDDFLTTVEKLIKDKKEEHKEKTK